MSAQAPAAPLPFDRVVHCDWGTHPRKRRMAAAERLPEGRWIAGAVEPAGDLATLIERARSAGPGAVLVGFDFPIGVPSAWAQAAGVPSFRELLLGAGRGEWIELFDVCRAPAEIHLRRPFYPYASSSKGSVARAHQTSALGLERGALLRRCDALAGAEVLFWTLGAKQVGKGALVGWRYVLAPAARDVRLWPFDGSLAELAAPGAVVVAETYPASFYGSFARGVIKSERASRARAAPGLLRLAAEAGVDLAPELRAAIEQGFASDDDFDAAVGLLGMLRVVLGRAGEGGPLPAAARTVEGWILGAGDGGAAAPRALSPQAN